MIAPTFFKSSVHMLFPSKKISPDVQFITLVITFNSVDFPAPFGPNSPYIFPFSTLIDTFSSIIWSLIFFVKFLVSSIISIYYFSVSYVINSNNKK